MSVIIRLQGLPWSASAMDIRNFFKGLSIPPGGVRIIGGENGDAFIAFSTDEDARKAMMLNNGLLNECQVQLFLSSKTEMQNTITQAKVKAPVVPGISPATQAPTTPVSSNVGISLNQIPSVQQISQAFPAVGQIIGQLGLQQPTQMNQYQSGLQTDRHKPTQAAGFFNNSNMNSVHAPKDNFTINRYEQELPGEYAVGGMQNMNNAFGDRPNIQRQYDNVKNLASNDRGFPQMHQTSENTSSKDQFRGEVYFPPSNVSFENNYGQENMNQNNQGRPLGNKQGLTYQSGNFSVQAGHGKPFKSDQGSNSQQFGHGKPFNIDQGGNRQEFGHGKSFISDQGNNSQEFGQEKPFQTDVSMNNTQPYQNDALQQITLQPREFRMPIRGQTNPGDSNYPPRNRPTRFGPNFQPNDNNAPPTSRQIETSFAKPSQTNNQYSSPSPVKTTPDRPTEARDKFKPGNPSTDDKSNVPSGGLILSNKRDEFGRNVPYSLRDGNVIDSSRTPTQDEKFDDNRSTESRSKDSSRRSSHSRDRSRDRSSRRDSPRDRDRRDRDRDRGKREREDDRRPRRDRERDKDRDRKQRDRDNDRYDRNRESKDTDRMKSPLNEANRKARKRSLSPSSRNKSENEKKQLIEKPEQHIAQEKQEDAKNKPKTTSATPVSVNRGPLIADKPLVSTENEKKSGMGVPPIFPVITPQHTGKGLLGEAPANLPPFTSTGLGSLNPPQSFLNSVNVPSKIGFRHEGPGPGSRVTGHVVGQGIAPLLPEKIPPGRSGGQALLDLPETFEYDHSGSVIGEMNRDMAFNSRHDFRGPRDEQLNVNAPPDFRGPGRGMPPLSFLDEQQNPGLNAGPRGRLDGQRPLNARKNDAPFPFPRTFRGPHGPGGPHGRNMPPRGPDRGIYPERSRDFHGSEGRQSLLGDGGAPHDFQGYPGRDGFQDSQIYDETGLSNFPGSQHDERFESDFGEFEDRFDDIRTKDIRGMPSLLDDIPFGGRRDFQGRQGRDIPRGRDDHLSDLRDAPMYEARHGHEFHGSDNRNVSGSEFRDDRAHGNVGGFGDLSGQSRVDRGEREFWGPMDRGRDRQRRDFDRMPGHVRDADMGPQNSFDSYREDDHKRMHSARDRQRRPFDKDDQSVGDFERRERYESRDNRSSARHQENNRDRSDERTREERNKRDDRKSSRADDRSGDRKYPPANVKTETKSKQVDNKKEETGVNKDSEPKQDKIENDVQKGTALCSVVLQNIPVETTYKDIRKLFSGLEIPKDGIKIINDKDGKRIGKAYVRFGSQESFKKGLLKDKTRLEHKSIVIKPVSKNEFDAAIDSYLPPSESDDDDESPDIDMCNSLSATLRALKGEPVLQSSKKASPLTTKDFVVKLTLLPEYTKVQNIKRFFQGLNIAQNGDAIYIEPGQFDKPCSGLCYVEFADENSLKKALSQKKMFEKKAINLTQGNKNDVDKLKNKLIKKDTEIENKYSEQPRKNTRMSDKSDNESGSKLGETKITSQSTENKNSNAVSMKSAYTCLKIQNIPKGMKVFELRSLFETVGVSVKVAQICHDAVGKPIGEGYVDLPSFSDVQKCLVKDKTYIGKNKITIEPVTKTEMIENMRLLRQSLQPETPTTKAVYFFVKAANCPKTVSTGEIMNFFSGFNPAPESIRLNIGDGSEPQDCSTALVGFRTREEAETAIAATNGNLLRNKNIVLTKVIL